MVIRNLLATHLKGFTAAFLFVYLCDFTISHMAATLIVLSHLLDQDNYDRSFSWKDIFTCQS